MSLEMEGQAKLFSRQIKAHIVQGLREDFPFLKPEPLNDIAEQCASTAIDILEAQIPIMEASKANTNFMGNLPPELRNRIYEYVLQDEVTPTEICVQSYGRNPPMETCCMHCPQEADVRIMRNSSITQVCRQMREETLEIFYSEKVFVANFSSDNYLGPVNVEPLSSWVTAIGPTSARSVKFVELRFLAFHPERLRREDERDQEWECLRKYFERIKKKLLAVCPELPEKAFQAAYSPRRSMSTENWRQIDWDRPKSDKDAKTMRKA